MSLRAALFNYKCGEIKKSPLSRSSLSLKDMVVNWGYPLSNGRSLENLLTVPLNRFVNEWLAESPIYK